MIIIEIFQGQNLIKIYTPKRTKLHHFKKISRGACPRAPLAKRMASPCAACRFATCKFENLKKKISCPSPAKSWERPWSSHALFPIANSVCFINFKLNPNNN